MIRIVLLDPKLDHGFPKGHYEWVLGSRDEALAHWPPVCDLVVLPRPQDCLSWIYSVRQRETDGKLPRQPMLGISGPPDAWPVYAAGLDGCLGQPPWELEMDNLPGQLPLWCGHAFNLEAALEIMGSLAIVTEVVAAFLRESPKLFADLEAACRAGSSPEIARAAHRFAGGVGIFGPNPTLNAALAMESAARAGQPVAPILPALRQAVARLRVTLAHLPDPGHTGSI